MNPSCFPETPLSLSSYDSEAYGPLFAVSDEGSAAQIVLDAAYSFAKAQALGACGESQPACDFPGLPKRKAHKMFVWEWAPASIGNGRSSCG